MSKYLEHQAAQREARKLSKAPRTDLQLRVSIELKDKLTELAEAEERSVNWYANKVLEDHVLSLTPA